MTPADLAQTTSRIKISESCRLYKYLDTENIPTIGWGLNLDRSNLQPLLEGVGANYAAVMAAPTARTSDPADAVAECITQPQADALFSTIFPSYLATASNLLASGIFDSLLGPRQCVWVDMSYNTDLPSFTQTIALLNAAQQAKNAGSAGAHNDFNALADHMMGLPWYGEVEDRAKRDVAMMRTGVWCDPNGNGNDIL